MLKTRRMTGSVLLGLFRSMCMFAALFVLSNCTPNQRIIESAKTPQPAAAVSPTVSGFDADLEAMRIADFKFILVFRRKDGGPIDAEDKAVINANTPPDANRRTLSDNGKAVIIGSNFPFYPGTIEMLTSRFEMEDFSKDDAGPIEVDRLGNSNAAANTNKKATRKQAP